MAKVDAMAEIFAGMNAQYTSVPGWNTANKLGNYVAERWNIEPDKSLIETLRTMFLLIVGRVVEAIKAQAGLTPANPEFIIDTTIEEAVAALTGTWEITYPAEEGDDDDEALPPSAVEPDGD